MKKFVVLVTGAAGFVGRALIRKLSALNYGIVPVDSSDGDHHKIDVSSSWSAPENFDAVVHLAAFPSVVHSSSQRAYCDVLATQHTLAVTGRKKIVFASSSSVYGNRKNAVVGDPLSPLCFYAWSKVMGECLMPPNCSILRFCNIYGGDDSRGVWAQFQKAKENFESAVIYGDGTALRSYVHIDDVVRTIVRELGKSGDTQNVCGEDWSVYQIAEKIGVKVRYELAFPNEALINTVR